MSILLGFGFGPMEMVILLVIILLLFGNRLPSLMRSLGQGVVEFKKGINDDENRKLDDEAAEEDSKQER